MSGFRAGKFERHQVFGAVRPFCPTHAVHKLEDVDPAALANRGIKLIMIDVDNTLVVWRKDDFAQETLDWIAKAKSHDVQIVILSNTRNPARLERLAAMLDIPALRGKFKPSTAMYKEALERFGVKESQAVMIGDKRKFPAVLIAPHFPLLEDWARANQINFSSRQELIANTKVRALYEGIVADLNRGLARFEKLKKVIVVPDQFSPEDGTLTASMKLRRRVVEEKYRKQIEELYSHAESVVHQD